MLLRKDACGERRHRCSKAHGQSQSCPRCQLELVHRHLGMKRSRSKPNSFRKSQTSISTDPQPAAPEINTIPHLNPKKAQPYKPFPKRHGTTVASQQSPRTPDSFPDFQHVLTCFAGQGSAPERAVGCAERRALHPCGNPASLFSLTAANSRATCRTVPWDQHPLPPTSAQHGHARILLAPSTDMLG